jgi:hypothetical protein
LSRRCDASSFRRRHFSFIVAQWVYRRALLTSNSRGRFNFMGYLNSLLWSWTFWGFCKHFVGVLSRLFKMSLFPGSPHGTLGLFKGSERRSLRISVIQIILGPLSPG